jgi:hypothetical protein
MAVGAELTLTMILAIWGAVISTVLALLKVKEFYREDRPKIKVSVAGDYIVIPKESLQNPYGDKPLVSITAVNIGRRPVTLKKGALLLPKGVQKKKYLLGLGSIGSIELTEGQSHDYYLLEDEIKEKGLTPDKYVACVIDAAGRRYWSHGVFKRYSILHRIR